MVFPFRFALWAKYAASLRSAAETEKGRCSAAVCPRSCRFRTAYGKQQRAFISPPLPLVTAAGAAVRCSLLMAGKAAEERRKDCEGCERSPLSPSLPPFTPPLSLSLYCFPPFRAAESLPLSGHNRYSPKRGGKRGRKALSPKEPPATLSAVGSFVLPALAPRPFPPALLAAGCSRSRTAWEVSPPAGGDLGVATPKNLGEDARR